MAPDFYLEERTHLKELCDILQLFYERKLVNSHGRIPEKLIIEYPPRHGKTRTLILFCTWVLGKNAKTKIITSAYNDTFATDFSKYTRNTISEERNTSE
jgi:hypothetical protein